MVPQWGIRRRRKRGERVNRNEQREALQAEPLRTASGGKLVRGEVNRKGVSSTVRSHDH